MPDFSFECIFPVFHREDIDCIGGHLLLCNQYLKTKVILIKSYLTSFRYSEPHNYVGADSANQKLYVRSST
jgi:hypothetical protein